MKHCLLLIALFFPLCLHATEMSLKAAFCSKKMFDRERDKCNANIYYRKGFAGFDFQCYKDVCSFECSLGANQTCFSTILGADDCTKEDYLLAFCGFVSRKDPTTYPYCMENEIDLHDFYFTPAVCMKGNCIPAEMLCRRNEILWPQPTTAAILSAAVRPPFQTAKSVTTTSTTTSSTTTSSTTTSSTTTSSSTSTASTSTTSCTTSSTTTSTPRLIAEESFSFSYINTSLANSTSSRKRKCTSSDYYELSIAVS